MTLAPRGQQGESGAAALALLTMGIILALGIFMVMAAPLTQASDTKARSRSAADAAALAAVEAWKINLRDALTSEGWLGDWDDYRGFLGGADVAARRYAELNGAEVIEAYPTGAWSYYVRVRGDKIDGKRTETEAYATLDLPSCDTTEDDDVPMAMGLGMAELPDDEDDEEEEEPSLPGLVLDCVGLDDIDLLPSDDGSYNLVPSLVEALIGESHAKLTS